MRLEQLEYLLDIADSKSLNVTAERKFISQSALSESMQKLEKELGGELFRRSKKGVELTSIGYIALRWAEVILKNVEDFKEEVFYEKSQLENGGISGVLKIGASATSYNYALPMAIAEFQKINPHIEIMTFQVRIDEIETLIKNKVIDIGIINFLDQDYLESDVGYSKKIVLSSEDLAIEKLLSERIYILCHKDVEFSKDKSITLKEVLTHKISLLSDYGYMEHNLLQFINQASKNNITSMGTNSQIIGNSILKNKCVTFVTKIIYKKISEDYRASLDLLKIHKMKEPFFTTYYALRLKDQPVSDIEELFMDFFRSYIKSIG